MVVTTTKFAKSVYERYEHAATKAAVVAGEEMLQDCNFYAPKREGTLIDSSITNSIIKTPVVHSAGLSVFLIWNTPYAHRLFYGWAFNFSKDANPNAMSMWYWEARSRHLNDWMNTFKKSLKENLK